MQAFKNISQTISEKIDTATAGLSFSTIKHSNTFTRMNGCPFSDIKNSRTAGPTGPLVSDIFLTEKLQHFAREKIPARNVHALGTGAYGKLTVTNDISKYTKAEIFSRVGHTTEFACRLSGTFTEQGDSESFRDLRGFAMKFYTPEGNWDLMTINTPVFAVRDAKAGPDQVHAFKRDPRTAMWNSDQFWDYNATHPEGLHQLAMIYTDLMGTPMSYRLQDWYGCNTYSMYNSKNERVWVKFHLKNMQGSVKGFNLEESKAVAGEDPNFLSRDLYESIQKGNYPRWKLMIQVMPEEEGYNNNFTFDCTKVWSEESNPLIEVGDIELNKNPANYFSEVEQIAFSPANVIPGIGHSPDKLLQGRLLIYDDTQLHRIGPNFKQLYINRPHNIEPMNNYLGGNMNLEVKDKYPHYSPSLLGGGLKPDPSTKEPPMRTDGPADFYNYPGEGSDDDYYGQVAVFWKQLPQDQKENMCKNIAYSLSTVSSQKIIDMMLFHFNKCSPNWSRMVEEKINQFRNGKEKSPSQLLTEKLSQEVLSIHQIIE